MKHEQDWAAAETTPEEVPPELLDACAAAEGALRRPKVMFLTSHSAVGGASEIWSNLAVAMARRGYPVRLAAFYPPVAEPRQPVEDGLAWDHVLSRKPASALGGVALFAALLRFLARHKPDVVYTALPAAGVMVPLAAQLLGGRTRVIVSHHSPVDTHGWLSRRFDNFTGRLPCVTAVAAVSEAVGGSLGDRSAAYRAKLRVIHNSLPPAIEGHLAKLARGRIGRVPGRNLIAVGRLAPEKNCGVLLRALARVPDATLTLVGAGPEEAGLRDLADELGIADRVRFPGLMPRTEALSLLADSDIFLQPSLFEGHSLALIEASKLGVPLIVSSAPSQIEGVTGAGGERCGVVVDPHNEVALAMEIRRILDDANRRRDWVERSWTLGRGVSFEGTVSAYLALGEAAHAGARPDVSPVILRGNRIRKVA